jgi:hypothetical protein
MMVRSWPCKVSSEIHINGRRVSEPVREDMGKMTAIELKDKRDSNRAHVVLSKSHEVVGPGYSRVIGVAAKVTDMRENSGNHCRVNWVSKTEQHYTSWVNQVSQNSITDQQADRVGQATWVSPSISTDRRTNQVSRVNRVSQVGNTEHNKGCSNHVANMESQITENSGNTENQITENLANTKNRVTQDSGGGGQKTGRRTRCCSKEKASSTVVPKWYYQDTKM